MAKTPKDVINTIFNEIEIAGIFWYDTVKMIKNGLKSAMNGYGKVIEFRGDEHVHYTLIENDVSQVILTEVGE